MTGITRFQALSFELVDGHHVQGQEVDCESPALAIQMAKGLWQVFGHAGAVAATARAISTAKNRTASLYSAGSDMYPTSI
jgi:hypothetical protein